MDAMEQGKFDMFRRDVRVAVSNESHQDRRIVRSIGDEYDDQFDDLEALRLAALRTVRSKNSYAKPRSPVQEVGNLRRVSLGQEDKADLQIITLERCNSFSSSSTDYEEIDLSASSDDKDANEDVEVFPDPEENGSDVDADDGDDNESIRSSSSKEEEECEELPPFCEEMDTKEYLSEDHSNEELNDARDTDDEVEESSQYNLELSEDELLESDDEISVSNDISITIPNEMLTLNGGSRCLEVDQEIDLDPAVDAYDSNEEQVNDCQFSEQQMILEHSENEQGNESEFENDIESTEDHYNNRTKSSGDEKITTSAPLSSENVKTDLSYAERNTVRRQEAKKAIVEKETPLKIVVNTNSTPLVEEKTKPVSSSKDKQQSQQESRLVAKTEQHSKVTNNEKVRKLQSNGSALKKPASREVQVKASNEKLTKAVLTDKAVLTEPELESESKRMDFDQLSIEDEDSEFEEGEEEKPSVKSRIGLNRIPSESLGLKQSHSWDNQQQRYSQRGTRVSSHLDHSHPSSHDRTRDQSIRYRPRERFRSRSRSRSPDRASRGMYRQSRYRRSRSRDRKQNRITSNDGRNRENSRRRSRSQSRSRTRRIETEIDSNFRREAKRENVLPRTSRKARESHEISKATKVTTQSRLQSRELKSQTSVDNKKTANLKPEQSKSPTTQTSVTNGTKVKLTSKVPRNTDGRREQSKADLRARLAEKATEKATVKTTVKTTVNREETGKKEVQTVGKEKELDARIQRIKQRNDAILKRAKEIQADKMKYKY